MKHIQIHLEDDEHQLLVALAEARGMSIAQHCKSLVLSCGINVELPTTELIKQHTDEVMELKKMLKPLLQTIADSEYASNADIRNLIDGINEMVVSEKKFLELWISMKSDIKKETSKSVQKAIQKQLKKERAKVA